jgi:hypothetical protein
MYIMYSKNDCNIGIIENLKFLRQKLIEIAQNSGYNVGP